MIQNPYEVVYTRLANIESILYNICNIVSTQQQQHVIAGGHNLTVKDAAEMLNLSVSTIYSLVRARQIPVSKKGNRLYFSQDELVGYIKTGRKKTLEEMKTDALHFKRKKGG